MKLTKQQYRVLCLALVEYRTKMEDGVRRCRYAIEQSVGYNVSRIGYREDIAEKLVVYEQRRILCEEVMKVVGREINEK